ncbi:MAG: ornithine carbamoyltransferase [Leptospirales bacterium]
MNRHLLTLTDIGAETLRGIIDTTIRIKNSPNLVSDKLASTQIGILFEKPSTRTRISLEVGISQLGGNAIYLNSQDIQLSRGESIPDTARVFSRYLDALVIRTKSHKTLEQLARFSDIPVINGLSDLFHPLQIIADLATLKENGLILSKTKLCFIGDTNNNVSRSMAIGAALSGLTVVMCSPEKYMPDREFLTSVEKLNGKIILETNPEKAISDCDAVYTDVWVSMGDESQTEVRKRDLQPYQLNKELYNKADKKPFILHCLPANKGEEITEEVFESDRSRIFDQAENRLHSVKAVLLHCLNKA